jgi:hypothetical protein
MRPRRITMDRKSNLLLQRPTAMGDPEYCETKCPICTRARNGHPVAKFFQKIELIVTFGGCPHGRARQRKYGVRPNEPLSPGTKGET